MLIDVLYSSSDGNACRISAGRTSILIDCGVTRPKLYANGRFPVDGIFISHGHHDHHSGVPVLAKYEKMPVYLEEEVFRQRIEQKPTYFAQSAIHHIKPGDEIEIGSLLIHIYESSHDSVGGLNFIVEEFDTGAKFAHITDTGIINGNLAPALKDCQGLLLEANHDRSLLESYELYPRFLKQRISGDKGHLSNCQAFDLIREQLDLSKTSWIVFGHLSKKTNDPVRLLREARKNFPGFDEFHLAPVQLEL